MGKVIDNYPILVAETVAIRETIQMAAPMKLSNINIESDFRISINSNTGQKVPSRIANTIKDVTILAKAVSNIRLSYCNRIANKKMHRISKKANDCTSQSIVLCY